MSTDERSFQFEQREFELRKAELEKLAKDLEAKADKLAQKELDMEFSAQKNKILSQFKAEVAEGKLMPHIIETIERDLDGQKLNFSDSSKLGFSVETARAIAEAGKNLVKEEIVEQKEELKFASADEALDAKIKEIMAASGRSYEQAAELAFSDSKLAEQYAEQANKEYRI